MDLAGGFGAVELFGDGVPILGVFDFAHNVHEGGVVFFGPVGDVHVGSHGEMGVAVVELGVDGWWMMDRGLHIVIGRRGGVRCSMMCQCGRVHRANIVR